VQGSFPKRLEPDMSLDPARIRAVLFDYGNTLIQFSRPQVHACDDALGEALERLFGPVDRVRLKEIRDADRVAPYRNGLRERGLAEMTTRLVEGLYGRQPGPDEIAVLVRARFDAVVQAIVAPGHVPGLLERVGRRYRLGLVSNYPDAEAIRTSLGRLNLARHFESVVISADVGRVKPHPLPFTTCLDGLGVVPAEVLYVGDNWLADVQGAKRLGMQVVRTIQYEAPEHFDPQPGDSEPDGVIEHLSELPALLNL
jgi:putative hydrolase of the HAD superfamily